MKKEVPFALEDESLTIVSLPQMMDCLIIANCSELHWLDHKVKILTLEE